MTKTDRRVQRTRDLLQNALIELISKRGYDATTIQDIVGRANVGRTTFYLHYRGKDELFMSCHQAIVGQLHFGLSFSREGLLSPEAPPSMISTYRHLLEARTLLYPIFQGKDSLLILRRIREQSAQKIEASLRATFAEADSTVPLDVLANYLAGAQIAVVQWWLEKRQPHTPENLAQTFYRLQRAAIRDAFALTDGE
jgi:AcrR family transcriptional regulator